LKDEIKSNNYLIDRDKLIGNLSNKFFDKEFKYKVKNNYMFYKSSFCKAMTIKLSNSKEFTDLILEKKNSKRIFYFYKNDEYKISKMYAETKNISVKRKFNLINKLIFRKLILFYISITEFKTSSNDIIFILTHKKYKPIFNRCSKFINQKYNNFYFQRINDLLSLRKFTIKRNKLEIPNILLKSNLETIYNIIIKQNLIKEFLSISKPKAIISVEGDSIIHSTFAYFCPKQTKSICFQWGSFTKDYVKNGFKNMYQKTKFVWSDYYKKKFIEDNKNTNFIKAGNPLLKNNKGNKRTDIVFLLSPISPYIKEKTYKELINIIKWTNKFKDKKIIIRFHPNDSEKKIKLIKLKLKKYNFRFHRPSDFSLQDSIQNACIAISIRSSALIEITRSGVIPIIFNTIERDLEKYFYDIKKIGLYAENVTKIKNLIKKIINSKKSNFQKNLNKKIIQIGKKYTPLISENSEKIIANLLRRI